MNSRYSKIIKITANTNEINDLEKNVNATVDIIKALNGKVVNHSAYNFGLSPMYLLYTVVYERESAITDEEIAEYKAKR